MDLAADIELIIYLPASKNLKEFSKMDGKYKEI